MSGLKGMTRAKGLTQASLAKDMGVSLPTIKRWFSGKGVTLENLFSLLDLIGVSFQDLIEFIPPELKGFQYSSQQEEFFTRNPMYLAYFDRLLAGDRPQDVARQMRLTAKSTSRYLSGLEKIGLIEVHPENKIRMKVEGEPQWSKDGPLATKFRASVATEFIEKLGTKKIHMGLHRLLPEDRDKSLALIKELQTFLMGSENRAKFLKKGMSSYGFMVALAPFESSLLTEIKNL